MSTRPPKSRPARRPSAASAGGAATVDTPAFASAADRPRPSGTAGAADGLLFTAPRGQWLSAVAVGIAIVVVIARVMASETIRAPGSVYPGSPDVPAGAGPAAGLLLDLLAGLCPLLVLARRWFDPTFGPRRAWSPVLLLALGGLALASVAWAGDRFAAVVSASHLLAAAGVLWAVAQVSRDWRALWRASALSAGLLAVLLVQGLWYYFVDRQDLIDQLTRDPDFVAKVQNVQPGTFAYTQMQNSILHGELRGFSVSANTYGALLVLLGLVTLGALLECFRQRRWGGLAVAGLLLLVDACVLPLTQSRTALLTGVLGAGIVVGIYVLTDGPRDRRFATLLRRRAGTLYFVGLIGVLAAIAFVVGYGVTRGTLFHDSLNFRWRYWTASADLWRRHPWLGVGWENFGFGYLGVRTPEATEEIKDPHDFLVRFTTELGLLGGLIAVLWTARTWWELTRPIDPTGGDPAGADGDAGRADASANPQTSPRRPLPLVLAFALPLAVGVGVNFLASVDLSADGSYVGLEFVRRCVFAAALLAAAAPLAFRLVKLNDRGTPSAGPQELAIARATSAAPAVRLGLLVALGMFFVHNLVDFAMFEVGPMFLFALLLGTAVGTRTRDRALPDPLALGDRLAHRDRRFARVAVALLGAAWLAAAVLLVGPIVSAEAAADRSDDALRKNQPRAAATGYESAFAEAVRNPDYAARAARAWQYAGDPARAKASADQAVGANPTDPSAYADRADLLLTVRPPDVAAALADLDRAVALDPMNRTVRLRYAATLEQARRPRAALDQYATALALNERLTADEKKRFAPAQVWQTFAAIARLSRVVLGP